MFKAKQKRVSLVVACLTALCAMFFAFVGIFSVPTTTASAATETETMSVAATTGTYSNNDQTVTWTGTNFTYTHNKGSGSAFYKTDTSYFRAYANTNGSITAKTDITFTKIVITCTSNSYATACANSFNKKVSGIASASSNTVTITPASGTTSVEYTSTAQWRLNKIVVTYEKANVCAHEYEWIQENGKHKEVCSLCDKDKEGTSWVACDGDLDYTILEAGANGTHKKAGVCSTCGANLSTDAEDCSFGYSIEGTTKTYTCECGNSYTEEIELRTISFSAPSNVTVNGDTTISSADGEVVTLPTTTNPDGYIFLGWATASIEGSTETKPTTYKSWTVNGDATLYAVYQKDVQPGGWSAVKNVADLTSGDIVTFAVENKKVAIGVSSNNFFTSITATFSNGVLQDSTSLTKLTVTKNASGSFSFKTSGNVYLNLNADDNYLKTSSSITNNSSWTITISGSSATITNVAYNARLLQYNASSPRFACYTSNQVKPTIYEFTEGEPISYVTTFCEHDGDTTTNTVPPTCTQKGSETTTCDLCGVQLSYTELNATNHANQTTTTQPATCTEPGATIVTCDDCHITLSSTPIPETGHSWDEGTITTPPQVGVEGELTFTCQNGCGETMTESIPALDTVNYTVSYSVPNGVANVPSEEIAEGFNVVLPSAEALAGYTFVGWTTEEYRANTAAPTTIYKTDDEYEVNEDTTFFALYSYILGSNDFTKVTDASKLAVGKEIVIVASGYDFALSTENRTNNRGSVAITKSDDTITLNENVQIITLESGTKANTFAFNIGGAYLYAASSSSNHLKTTTDLDDNGSWTITVTASGVATIKAQGSNTHNALKFNNSNSPKIFSCYESGQNDVAIYVKNSTIYYTTELVAHIDSATISVGETLTVNYKVTLSETFATAVMYFTYEGEDKTYDVTGVKQGDGRYSFSLEVPPQAMTTNIRAELKYGEYLLAVKENYSIKTYAVNMLNKEESSPELKQLLIDILYYGAAAQNYTGYNLENLATAGIESFGSPSNATPAAVSAAPVKNTEVSSYPVYFKSATVWFSDVNMISVKINTLDGARLLVNGVEVELTSTTYTTDALRPTQFDETFTFELYNGEVLMQTLTYSVNAYAYKMKDNADMGELALALYRYGVSAKAYIN